MSFRPDDPRARCVDSKAVATKSVAIKISAPKWTGRKRKRGSDKPFEHHESLHHANGAVRDSVRPNTWRVLRDNPSNFSVNAVGHITQTHRFRSLPDFQYALSTMPLAQRFINTVATGELSKIKQFSLSTAQELQVGDDFGPASLFNLQKVPAAYDYKRSPYSRLIVDPVTGEERLENINRIVKQVHVHVAHDIETVPQEPPENLPPENQLEAAAAQCVVLLRAELEKRPLIVKRVQQNMIKVGNEYHLRRCWPYVGYMFRSGPFRDSIIKYGVDPRSDVKYRKYQSLIFQVPAGPGGVGGPQTAFSGAQSPRESRSPSSAGSPRSPHSPRVPGVWRGHRHGLGKLESQHGDKYKRRTTTLASQRPIDSHIFDGARLCRDGKTWQLIDITDPMLRKLINTKDLRDECDINFSGWYGNGTYAAIRLIMKEKIKLLAEGHPGDSKDAMFKTLLDGLNAFMNEGEEFALYQRNTKDPELLRMSCHLRVIARLPALKQQQTDKMRAKGLLGLLKEGRPQVETEADLMDIDDVVDEDEIDALQDEEEAGEMDVSSDEVEDGEAAGGDEDGEDSEGSEF